MVETNYTGSITYKKNKNRAKKAQIYTTINKIIDQLVNQGKSESFIIDEIKTILQKYEESWDELTIERYRNQIRSKQEKIKPEKTINSTELDKIIKTEILYYLSQGKDRNEIIDSVYATHGTKVKEESIEEYYYSVIKTLEILFNKVNEDIYDRSFDHKEDIFSVAYKQKNALFNSIRSFLSKVDPDKDTYNLHELTEILRCPIYYEGKTIKIENLLSKCIRRMIKEENEFGNLPEDDSNVSNKRCVLFRNEMRLQGSPVGENITSTTKNNSTKIANRDVLPVHGEQ